MVVEIRWFAFIQLTMDFVLHIYSTILLQALIYTFVLRMFNTFVLHMFNTFIFQFCFTFLFRLFVLHFCSPFTCPVAMLAAILDDILEGPPSTLPSPALWESLLDGLLHMVGWKNTRKTYTKHPNMMISPFVTASQFKYNNIITADVLLFFYYSFNISGTLYSYWAEQRRLHFSSINVSGHCISEPVVLLNGKQLALFQIS